MIFVDFHAETTSEKLAICYYLDGKVTAVIGTHTHVQTADERILPGGTACLTDVGMTGPHDGVIGMDKDAVIARFLTGLPGRFETATGDPRLHWGRDHRRSTPAAQRTSSGSRSREDELKAITETMTLGGTNMSRLPFDDDATKGS